MNQKYTKKSNKGKKKDKKHKIFLSISETGCIFIILSSVTSFHELQTGMFLNDLLTPNKLIFYVINKKKKR